MKFMLVGVLPFLLAACAAAPLATGEQADVPPPVAAQAPPVAAVVAAREAPEDAMQAWIVVGLPLQHQPVVEIYDDLRHLLTGREECRFVPNERSNTLVVFGTSPMIDRVRDIVGQLDTPTRPVAAPDGGR